MLRLIHIISYMFATFLIVITWFSNLPLYEQIFRTGIVVYISIIYIEFLDGHLLTHLKLSALFEERKSKNSNEHDISDLIQSSSVSLYWIRLVQQSESIEERNMNLTKLKEHVDYIKSLKVPAKFKKDHQELINELKGYLMEIS